MFCRSRVLGLEFVLLLTLFCIGCSSEEILGEEIQSVLPDSIEEERVFTEAEDSIGRLNAVKKAYQMTDLEFTPLNTIEHNLGSFEAGETYKGLIYSSVKEIETYVGSNVSFHTFMTAINNPRSKIYTEQINKAPYHGKNCKAYYGTVCSGLVTFALGLNSPRLNSFDFPDSELMELIEDNTPEKLKIADVLWKKGHVALITDIIRDDDGMVSMLEISEAIGSRCKRYYVSRKKFIEAVMSNFKRIYRYKEIGSNTCYIPANEFVAVGDEALMPFVYNNDLCVDKGDRSNYLEGEKVIINIMNTDGYMIEVYKDDNLYLEQEIRDFSDYPLDYLSYGDYKARIKIIYDDELIFSDYTYWKVINADAHYDRNNKRLYFNSSNAVPDHVICCDISGTRPPLVDGYCHVFSKEDIQNGFINIKLQKLIASYPYFEVLLSTEYGRIIYKKIKWM